MNGNKNELPSGQTWDDLYEHVYSCMEQSILKKEEESTIDRTAKDDTSSTATNERLQQIQSGLFAGSVAFLLFGPYGPEPRREVE